MRSNDELSLLAFPLNQPAEVSRVANQSAEMLELLQHKGIGIGTRLEVKKHFDFDHSIELKIKAASITISEQLAKNIFATHEP